MSNVRVLFISASLCLLMVAACHYQDNPSYCDDRAYDNCVNRPGEFPCSEKADCAGQEGKPACSELNEGTGTGICVQCTVADSAACAGVTPICGADATCKGCGKHSDCASAVCLADGSCGSEADVAYIAPTGAGTACTKGAPCGTLGAGVTTGKAIIKVAAGLVKSGQVTVIDGKAVTILADEGAKLDRDGDGAVLEVRSAGAEVKIFDLEITGATGSSGANGIDVNPNGGAPKLALTRVKLTGNQGLGLLAQGGAVVVAQSTISGNTGGGISISNATFDITNNFVIGNGSADMATGSSLGGMSLDSATTTNRLQFNTVAFNHAKSATLLAAGVACSVTGLVALGNIVTSNNEGLTFPAQTKGICTYGNSFVIPGTEANTLKFKNITANPPDFHLTAESPTSVLDAGGACTGVDVDGDARPQGGACDLGADEYKAN